MKYFYTEDLDTSLYNSSDEFVEKYLPIVTIHNIADWNKYNENTQILDFDGSHPLNKVIQRPYRSSVDGQRVDYRILYRKVKIEGIDYILMFRAPMMEHKDMIFTLLSQYSLLIFILIVVLVVVQRFMLRKMWTPFYDNLSNIESFTLEKGVVPEFKETDISEFNRLNQQVSALMQNNLKTYEQQKEFIENASHELQTPLAVFHSKLDILLQDPGLTESQIEIIESLYDVTSRLTGLTKNLLLLAKIDNQQFKDMERIDFVESLEFHIPYLEEFAATHGIKINLQVHNPLKVMANRTLLESLINNLAINAVRHNIDNGAVNLVVKDNSFIISNTGEKKALNENKLFKRFSRKDESKAGYGLGLCIAYQICKFHGWEIRYFYMDDLHCFIVIF
jgi:signal transduction histidine kinase